MSKLRERMTRDLRLAGLEEGTQQSYLRAVRQLAAYYMVSPDQLSERQVEDYRVASLRTPVEVQIGEPFLLEVEVRGTQDGTVPLVITRNGREVSQTDVEALRLSGFDDRGIHDICAITAYFAFVNRIADGLGVEMEASR